MKRKHIVAFVSGAVFALGLGISGMTQPAKVLGFLDVAGEWDPTLAFVMVGAIVVHLYFAIRAKAGGAPRFAPRYVMPTKTQLDWRLLGGAALFGVGWGIAGFCPGPAVVSVVTLSPSGLAFVAAMFLGMFAFERLDAARSRRSLPHVGAEVGLGEQR